MVPCADAADTSTTLRRLQMPDGTPLRNVRVPDDLWHAAMSKALDRGETLSEVIRRALEKYVKG